MAGWGAFAGGVSDGLSSGQDMYSKWRQMQQLQTAQRALADRQKALMASLQGPASPQLPGAPGGQQPGMPGQTASQPPTAGAGGPPAPPGGDGGLPALAAAQGGGGGPMAPTVQQPPQAGPPSAGGGMAPANPASPPQTPAGAAGGGNGPGSSPDQSGGAGFDMRSVVQDYQQIEKLTKQAYQDTAREIMQANPGKKWRKTEFIEAVNQEFKERQGLDPDLKQAILAESSATRARMQYLENAQRVAAGERNTDVRAEGQRYGQDLSHEDRQAMIAAQTKRTEETITGANRRADQASSDRRRGQDIGLEGRRETIAGANARAGGNLGRAKLEKALEGTAQGKDYAVKKTAFNTLQALYDMPDIDDNGPAQIQLINRALFMSTGSVRPPLAEIKKLLGDKDAQDAYDVITNAPGSAPLLGRDQIRKLYEAASAEHDASRAAAVADPVAGPIIRQLEAPADEAPSGGGGGAPARPATAPKYVAGMVRSGYRFKGGDPTKQANWAKVQ